MNKKQEIKKRIDLINKGETPTGYKKSFTKVLPKDWNEDKLETLCIKRTETAGNRELETLSISAGIGFVNQAQKFGRELSGKQYKHYIIINKGDFAYNKGNSKKYPQGCVYLLEDREEAAVPNVFNTFKLKSNCINGYYKQLFQIGYLNQQLHKYINFGVRNDGLLNLYDSDFYNVLLPCPNLQEQEKIAEILNCCDKVIELKEKLINEENNKKRIILNKIFSNKGKSIKLSKIALIIMGQSPDSKYYNTSEQGLPLIQGNADCEKRMTKPRFWTSNITKECKIGDIIMSVRAPAGIISRAMHNACIGRGVCAIRAKNNPEFLYQYLMSIENKWRRITQGSTFESINSKDIANILIPDIDKKKQEKYSGILRNCDINIDLLQQELEQYKQLKKSLSQLLLTGIVRVNEV